MLLRYLIENLLTEQILSIIQITLNINVILIFQMFLFMSVISHR